MKKRGQFSVEYLVITGFVIGMVIIGVSAYYIQSRETKQEVEISELQYVGDQIIGNVESVYYAGGFAKKTLKIRVPDIVTNISVPNEMELVFKIGESDMVFFSDVPIAGVNLPQTAGDISGMGDLIIVKNGSNVIICTSIYGCE